MKKRMILALFVLVLALLAAWWFLVRPQPAHPEAICNEFRDADAEFVRALKDPSGSTCASLVDLVDRATCTAWTTRDASACPALQQQACSAIARRDPTACLEGDAWCRALAANDPSVCKDPALDPGEQQECVAWVLRDERFFSATSECDQGALAQEAVRLNNPAGCQTISDAAQRQACLTNFATLG